MDLSRSSFKLFLSRGGNALLMFGGITFFANSLDAGQLGIYFLFQTVLGLLSIPADVGISGALEKRLSEGGQTQDRTLGSAVAFKATATTVVAAGILLGRGSVNDFIGANVAGLLVVGLATHEFSKLYLHAVRGELRVGETAPIEFANRLVWLGLGALLVTRGYGPRGIVVGLIAGSAVGLLWAYSRCGVPIGRPTMDAVKDLLAFSKYQTVTSVGGRVYSWMDVAFVGYFLASSYVSAYEIAWQVTLLVILVSKSIGVTLFPQISQWNEAAATERIGSSISTAMGVTLFISIPALVGATIFASDILRFIFGPEYVVAAAVLVVLMVEKVFQSVNDVVEGAVRAINRPDLAARATVVAVSLNLVLSPLLLVTVGFVGAAIATTTSWFVNTVLHARYLSRYVSFSIPYRLAGWYAASSLLMGGALLAVKWAVPVTGVAILVAEIAVGVAVYVAVTVAIPDVRDQVILPGIRTLI
ncbi:polysaccharide biosynthesis C-terminal domain-containing protein [Halopelagius fulvigenes]|uniref:Polysaccharide biosynthesis C-terminal domain-containing protein n=1 Tax=Halopelagius fulvigenes TaxID=1198324 RepID=A0ABD5TX48_9EURY